MTDHERMGISESEFEALTTEDKRWNWVLTQLKGLNLRQSAQEVELSDLKKGIADNTNITRQIADDTKAMRDAWADGVATKRFFCRLAQGWEFLLKRVFMPLLIGALIFAMFRAIFFGASLPEWASLIAKVL